MPEIDLGSVVGPPGPQGAIGPQGGQGIQGDPGPAATINGVNTLTITPGPNVQLKQEGSALEIGAIVPGKNLLDNSRWDNKEYIINQRGQTEYTTFPGYTIDRWIQVAGSRPYGKISVLNDKIFVDAGIDSRLFFDQYINFPLNDSEQYTLSFLADSGLFSITATGAMIKNATISVDQLSVHTPFGFLHFYNENGSIICGACVGNYLSEGFIAAKLELGPVQTLAHKEGDTWVLNDPPPNKALELAKCQSYYWKSYPTSSGFSTPCFKAKTISSGGAVALECSVQPPVTMRTRPSIRINGISPGSTVTLRKTVDNSTISGTLASPDPFTLTRDKLYTIWVNAYTGTVALGEVYEGTIELDANL